jgi:hypothetical protein
VLRGKSRLTLRGASVRFFSGDDLSEGPKGFVFGDETGAFVGDFNRLWREVKLIANGVQPEYVKRGGQPVVPTRERLPSGAGDGASDAEGVGFGAGLRCA